MYVPSKQIHSEQLYQQRMHLLPNSGWPCDPPSSLHPRNAHLKPATHGKSHFAQLFSPQLLSQPWFQPLHPHRQETGMGENQWESRLGKGGYGVSRFKQQRSDELIGVETSRMCMPLQLLTPSFGDGGLCECRRTPGAPRHLTQTNMRHPHPPHYSNMHVKAKTARRECCSDRPVFPQCEVWHLWESVE